MDDLIDRRTATLDRLNRAIADPADVPHAHGRGGSRARFLGIHVGAAALLALALDVVVAGAVPNLTVDGAQRFQRVAGMGANVNVGGWNGGALKPALDLLVRPAGSRGGVITLRVVREPMTWVTSESDLPLLHDLDPSTLSRIYEAPAMQDLWDTIHYLNLIGVRGERMVLNFMGWTPTWLGGGGGFGKPSVLTAGKESEFATMLASLVYYGRVARGLDFTLLAPLNEPDWNCLEGPCLGASQYVVVMRALIAELDRMGLFDIRLVGPDTAGETNTDTYIAAMMADATIAGRVDHFAMHRYGVPSSPRTPYAGHDYWLTETAGNCPTCDTSGTPSQGEWAFSTQTVDVILASLKNGMPLVAYWDGYDSFYQHHDHYGYWGLLAYDTSTAVYTPRKRFYADAQINGFVEPGTTRISLTSWLSGLGTTVAFFDSVSGRLSIVGRNTSTANITINGQLNNLPAIDSLACYLTDAGSRSLTRGSEIQVIGGSFAAVIPPNSVFSLAGVTRALVAVGPPGVVARSPSVSGAYPNPTGGGVGFALALAEPAEVSVGIFDVQGRLLWSAPTRRYGAGRWPLTWDGRTAAGPVPAGVYLARIRAGNQLFPRSVAIVR